MNESTRKTISRTTEAMSAGYAMGDALRLLASHDDAGISKTALECLAGLAELQAKLHSAVQTYVDANRNP